MYQFAKLAGRISILISFITSLAMQVHGQILIDEDFSDWQPSFLKADAVGGNQSGNLDLQKLWLTDDKDFLYIRLDLDREIKLQEDNKLGIQLDIDNNVNTGFKANGIGAELSIYFGDRDIFLNIGNVNQIITHEKIDLVSLPSVSSSKWEFRVRKSNVINNIAVNMANKISVVAVDRLTSGGDKLPTTTGGFVYQMSNNTAPSTLPYSLKKLVANHTRVMSYNSELDGLFDVVRGPIQKRIIKAANPDIICIQEIYNHTLQEVIAVMNATIPLPNGKSWQGFKTNPDNVTLTRQVAEDSENLNGNNISLLYLDAQKNQPIVIFNNHLPCCLKDDERQMEIDANLKRHRDMKANGGNTFNYPKNTPTIMLGDMNMVGLSQQQKSFKTGDIVNEATYGKDYKMDWDNSDFEDAKPFVPNSLTTYTWFSEGNGYMAGRLDYMFYSGSVMSIKNSFIFETATLDAASLQANNLLQFDSRNAADHIPVIVDFLIGVEILNANVMLKDAIKCFGDKASATVKAKGGLPPYQYSKDGGPYQKDSTFTNLDNGGQYIFSVKDANNKIIDLDIFEVPFVEQLKSAISASDEIITLNISGGTKPYFYNTNGINFSEYKNPFTVTENKKYIIVVKDNNGCIINNEVTIFIDKDNDGYNNVDDCNDAVAAINPGATEIIGNGIDDDCKNGDITFLTASLVKSNVIKCNGDKETITVKAKGGNRPYTYSIDGLAFAVDSVYNVSAGIYSPKVKDANGQLFDVGLTEIKQPDVLKVIIDVNGNIVGFNVSGGTPPYLISFDSINYSAISPLTFTDNKTYTAYFKDNNGCIIKSNFIINVTKTLQNDISKIKVYPNPMKDYIYVESDVDIKNIEVINIYGKSISINKGISKIDLSLLSAGIYNLQITTMNDKKVNYRIVKI